MPYTNLEYLNDFTGGDKELVNEAVRRYLKNSPDLLKKLNLCYKEKDWEQLAFVAHSLYSSTQIVGIVALAEPLREIQSIAKNNDQDKEKVEVYIKDINRAMLTSYEELSDYNKNN